MFFSILKILSVCVQYIEIIQKTCSKFILLKGSVLDFCAFFNFANPHLFGAQLPTLPPHSLRIPSQTFTVQLTFIFQLFPGYYSDRQMQIQCCAAPKAEGKRNFLSHLPLFELWVLLFESVLNSKWRDCCLDLHECVCIAELTLASSKRIF